MFLIIMSGLFARTSLSVYTPWFHSTVFLCWHTGLGMWKYQCSLVSMPNVQISIKFMFEHSVIICHFWISIVKNNENLFLDLKNGSRGVSWPLRATEKLFLAQERKNIGLPWFKSNGQELSYAWRNILPQSSVRPEYWGSTFLRNVGTHLQFHTASQPRRLSTI
jgi:hypothetical protein